MQTVDHKNLATMSRLFTQAYGDLGESTFLGILFTYAPEKRMEEIAQHLIEYIAEKEKEKQNA